MRESISPRVRVIGIAGFTFWGLCLAGIAVFAVYLFGKVSVTSGLIALIGLPIGAAVVWLLSSSRMRRFSWKPGVTAIAIGTAAASSFGSSNGATIAYLSFVFGFFGAPFVVMVGRMLFATMSRRSVQES